VERLLDLGGADSLRHQQTLTEVAVGEFGILLVAEDLDVPTDPIAGHLVMKSGHFFGRDFIERLIVIPEMRRQGIGTALLRAALLGATTGTVFTSTNTSNQPMCALLDREGWSVSGTLDGLDPGDPEIVYFHQRPD
jgi:GNAT superfamily N-acetyltransferase